MAKGATKNEKSTGKKRKGRKKKDAIKDFKIWNEIN